jgi:arabinofuranosyltransferase
VLLGAALVFFALALVYGVVVHFTGGVYPEDDAYITYRYVDNLVAGKGLVYNSGVHVFGASTPLYILWLAGLKLLAPGTPTPDLAVHLNFIFYLASAFGLCLLLRRLLDSWTLAAVLAGIFALFPDILLVSTSGMESLFFTALLIWSLWALNEGRWTTSSVLAGLSVMVRPEGVLVAGLVLLAWLFFRTWMGT